MPIVVLVATCGITPWQQEHCEKTLELLRGAQVDYYVVDASEAQLRTRIQLLKLANSLTYPQLYGWYGDKLDKLLHLGGYDDFLESCLCLNSSNHMMSCWKQPHPPLQISDGSHNDVLASKNDNHFQAKGNREAPAKSTSNCQRGKYVDSEGSSSSTDEFCHDNSENDDIVILQRVSSTISELSDTHVAQQEGSPLFAPARYRTTNSTPICGPGRTCTTTPICGPGRTCTNKVFGKRLHNKWNRDARDYRGSKTIYPSSTNVKRNPCESDSGGGSAGTCASKATSDNDGGLSAKEIPKLFAVAAGPSWLYKG